MQLLKLVDFFRHPPRANPADATARRACMRSQSLGHEYRRGQKHGKARRCSGRLAVCEFARLNTALFHHKMAAKTEK